MYSLLMLIGLGLIRGDLALTAWPQMDNFGQNSTIIGLGTCNSLGHDVEFLKMMKKMVYQ